VCLAHWCGWMDSCGGVLDELRCDYLGWVDGGWEMGVLVTFRSVHHYLGWVDGGWEMVENCGGTRVGTVRYRGGACPVTYHPLVERRR